MRSLARRLLPLLLLAGGLSQPWAAPTLDGARTAYTEGRITESIELYHRVAEAASEAGDAATAGIAHNNVCLVLAQHGDLEAALVDCRAALELRRTLDDLRALGRTQNNLGLILQHLARFDESETAFREALAINRQRGDVEAETVNLANLGVTAIQAGWYAKAIEFQRAALAIAEAHPDAPWAPTQARLAKVNQAVVLERLGAFREALALYDEVLETSDEMPAARRATLLLNRGVAYRNLGDPHRAREAFVEAEATYRRVGELNGLSNVKLNLGLVHHLNLEDAAGAEVHYREALHLSETSGDRADEIQDLYYLGRLLTDLGQLEEAEALFARCLSAAEASDSSEGRWAALAGLGRVEFARGELELALEHLEGAIDEIERVRGSLTAGELRSGYFGDKRAVYALTIEVLAALDGREPGAGHVIRALGFAHRAKARALLDRLGPAADRLEPPAPDEVVALIGEELLLEYFIGESHLFVWIVHGGRVALRAIEAPGSILDDVGRVHGALAGGQSPDAGTLSELSASLLDGLPESGPERIRIAPDGRLRYLPFELLSLGEDRLIERYTVSYLPSGATLAGFDGRLTGAARSFVGFGDPVLPDTDAPTPTGLLVARFGLGPLPAAAGELSVAGSRLPGESEIRTGAGATRKAFTDAVAAGARVVHLASHTVFDERPGRGAALLLSASEGSDGLMGPREIAELDYPVDLTVLAACRTALGAPDGGNALTMLTGAFLAAGSQAVIATLWDVGDVATGVFMEQFYYRLGEGDAPAVALREAKRRMLADSRWDDPSLWSAYVLIGETGPVVEARGPWRALGLLAVALMLAGLAYGLMRKRESSERPVTRSSASNASTDQR